MGISDWLKKNTLKETFGGLFDDYDLKQCVTLDRAINRHSSKISLVLFGSFSVMATAIIVTNEIMKIIDGVGLKDNPSMLALFCLVFSPLFMYFGYSIVLSSIQIMIKKRIRVIAGVIDDGQKA